MPADAVLVRKDFVEPDAFGAHEMELQTKYEAPMDGGGRAEDPHAGYDVWAAKRAQALLLAAYPGHMFGVVSDRASGVMKINIPILMGFDSWYVINYRTDATELARRVVMAGGLLLELYGLRRGRLQLGSFLDARAQHSRLVDRRRPIPHWEVGMR
jgi:hypothetical protein